jgi:hypothetical protein
LESAFCVAALDWALTVTRPEIFNTDQGAQFTSEVFTNRLEKRGSKQDSVGKGGVGSGCMGSWDSTKITGFADHGHYRKSASLTLSRKQTGKLLLEIGTMGLKWRELEPSSRFGY